ncbi:MAG: polyprenyl synthetase family protein [Oscillospiraceae bacterium]|nr:polyprenyl synthetase family protein [Oscillospiraceae bacterium]
MNFKEKYEEYKRHIEQALLFPEVENIPLADVMLYSLGAGGKRIRPVLVSAFCEAYGGEPQNALPIAAAIEILHTSTLIQDDLPCMDDDALRRGKPACHVAFSEAKAVLAASAMTYFAFEKIAETKLANTPRIIMEICGYMGMRGVYGGQELDLFFEKNPDDALKHNNNTASGGSPILKMYGMKTCALLQAACVSGCIAANADENAVKSAAEYAFNLGLAFQINDDILDLTSDPETLGKPVNSDNKNQKLTYVSVAGLEKGKKDAEKYTLEALKILENIPNSEFLKELTRELLNRKM